MGVPHAEQVARQLQDVRALLDPVTGPDLTWEPPLYGAESGFRNKAKMVVTGTAGHPRLGILDPRQHPKHHDGTGVDLQDCPLQLPGLLTALPLIARMIAQTGIAPYDVAARTGELKHVIATVSPDQDLMLRFVLRSPHSLPALRAAIPDLRQHLAAAGVPARVVTANLLPQHQALLEGAEEIHLAGDQTLTMVLNGIPLNLRPQGFFQTNTEIAAALYRQASRWLDATDAASAWDLYCGVGGFAFHLAQVRNDGGPLPRGAQRSVWGLETSADAVAAAQGTACQLGVEDQVRFAVGDATDPAHRPAALPDAVVVNPPRRGIGPELAAWLEDSGIPHVLYSSCNATTLARDLAAMPGYRAVRAQLLDMFPQTSHHEVMVQLQRR